MKNDRFTQIIQRIESAATPMEIAAGYSTAVLDLYWKAHDLNGVVAIGQAGLNYCFQQADAAGLPADTAAKLRGAAKGLAYNIASFTWPGWEEPGITPTPDQRTLGRQCAALNLQLAIELQKPGDKVSMAHWLVGAHALAAGDAGGAAKQFRIAQEVLGSDAAASNLTPLNRGYLAVAELAEDPASEVARASFAAIISQLKASTHEDAREYLKQLRAARRLFVQESD